MSTFTEHYDLTLPEDSDYYDVAVFNSNFDTLDGALAETTAEVEGVNDKIGAPADSGSETVFGKLNQIAAGGGSVIRSIQHFIQEVPNSSIDTDITITPVNPAKTLVLIERLEDNTNSGVGKLSYTLTTDNFHLTTGSYRATIGFWIIEFV